MKSKALARVLLSGLEAQGVRVSLFDPHKVQILISPDNPDALRDVVLLGAVTENIVFIQELLREEQTLLADAANAYVLSIQAE